MQRDGAMLQCREIGDNECAARRKIASNEKCRLPDRAILPGILSREGGRAW